MSRLRLVLYVSFVLLFCGTLFGQATSGGIFGTVTDPTGAVIAQAKVTLTDVSKGVTVTTTTNESGNYTQTHLTVGNYDVRVDATGFEAYIRRNVRDAGNDFALHCHGAGALVPKTGVTTPASRTKA